MAEEVGDVVSRGPGDQRVSGADDEDLAIGVDAGEKEEAPRGFSSAPEKAKEDKGKS